MSQRFSILDRGNLVASFDESDSARDALRRLSAASAEVGERLLLVEVDDQGAILVSYEPEEGVPHVT